MHTETTFKGLSLSRGIAVARVCLFNEHRHSNLPEYRVDGEGVELEKQRLRRSVAVAGERLEEVRHGVADRIGAAEAEIFVAQRMILEDETLMTRMFGVIEADNVNAESAVVSVLDEYENRLLGVDNEYIKERSTDFGEVKRRLLDVLANAHPSLQCAGGMHCQKGKDRIVVAQELTPSLTVEMDTEQTLGFITERGGVNSHAAILARALGIPAVSGIPDIHALLSCGMEVLIDGDAGEVVVLPREETLQRVQTRVAGRVRTPQPEAPVSGFTVMANISTSEEAAAAVAMRAEGIGLYRTEFELFAADRLLSEDEQYERYARVVAAMAGRPVTFRLFDIGGDKPLGFLDLPSEENPYLGWRGSRFLLDRRDFLQTQARALARVSAEGEVRVLYPMVVDLPQYRRMKELFCAARDGLPRGNLKHGVMFEVPAACLQAAEFFEECDFASIGTNDLVQYLFAVDRNNERVAYDYRPDREALWTLVRAMAKAAHDAGKPLSICGELAGDPDYIPRVREAGIHTVSVSPRLIPGVRLAAHDGARTARHAAATEVGSRKSEVGS